MRVQLSEVRSEPDEVEIVERKGLGHPDSICDALAEELSLALSRHTLEHAGAIAHHNVDKALLRAGRSEPAFSGGRMVEPIEIYLAGRAPEWLGDRRIPVQELAVEGTRAWLGANLRALDAERHVQIHCLTRPGSAELVELFGRSKRSLANDTSCGCGFAPLSDLEHLVLALENEITSEASRRTRPWLGEDVKVMGTRCGDRIELIVACAFVGRELASPADYLESRRRLTVELEEFARGATSREVSLRVNAADDDATESFYLTVTGTSAEAGDDGQTGRGNRVNGLICPGRPTTLESVAGKNPVTHVGKLYNIGASLIASALVDEIPDITEATCRLVSRIGAPVDEPELLDLRIRSRRTGEDRVLRGAAELARELVGEIPELWRELLEGRVALDRWPLRQQAPESV